MDAVAFAGSVLAWLMGLVVGARLLRIAADTHQTPELTIGLSYILTAGFGFAPMIVAAEVWRTQRDLAELLQLFGLFPICAGLLAISIGAWRIFRASQRWPLGIVAAIWLGTVLCMAMAVGAADHDAFRLWFWRAVNFGTLGWLWMGVEALLLFERLRRRARYGLASAEVANRVLLWAIASGAAVTSSLLGFGFQTVPDAEMFFALRLAQSAVQWGCVVAMWLAFFPPQAYRRRFAAPIVSATARGA